MIPEQKAAERAKQPETSTVRELMDELARLKAELSVEIMQRETWQKMEIVARALMSADKAATERCIKILNDQISYCQLRAEEKHEAGNKKAEDMFILMANTLSYQIAAIRKGSHNV